MQDRDKIKSEYPEDMHETIDALLDKLDKFDLPKAIVQMKEIERQIKEKMDGAV